MGNEEIKVQITKTWGIKRLRGQDQRKKSGRARVFKQFLFSQVIFRPKACLRQSQRRNLPAAASQVGEPHCFINQAPTVNCYSVGGLSVFGLDVHWPQNHSKCFQIQTHALGIWESELSNFWEASTKVERQFPISV